jgi:2-polyprenyl-6-methoxyphenol hydroxylase-like FAD-dependent oxidoreductase
MDKHLALVVGAGPVGLTMAAELARHGVQCRIVDRLSVRSPYCRAIGVTPRTMEVWDDMGIVSQMIDAGVWLEGMRLIVDGSETKTLTPDYSDLPYGSLGLPQYSTEAVLEQHLNTFGIAVERETTLLSLTQTPEGVRVVLQKRDGLTEEAAFPYVIGCDGAHSSVRKGLQIAFDGEHYPWEFMLGDVRIEWDMPRGISVRRIRPRENAAPEMFIAIPLPERHRYRITMLAPPSESSQTSDSDHGIQSERPGPTIEQLQAVADRLFPEKPKLEDLRWSSIFRISMRLASKYREGRVFIAGDAAHIHPPTGGQGMNTGIQDAYNLAWKLALVGRGAAPASLLDTYERERQPVGAEVVARTRAQSEGIGRMEGRQNRLVDTQLLVNYRESPLSEGSSRDGDVPQVGDRAPDCEGLRLRHVHAPVRLFDIFRGTRFVFLLYYRGEMSAAQIHFARNLAATLQECWAGLIKIALLSGEGPEPTLIGLTVYRDEENVFSKTYVAESGSCYAIRPDGHIGWTAVSPKVEDVLAYFENAVGLKREAALAGKK